MPKGSTGATPRQLLVSWANDQDGWVRSIVGQVLASKSPLTQDQFQAHYDLFVAEKGLSDTAAQVIPPLEDVEEGVQSLERLEILSLGGVSGVNALAPDQTVEFDPCLTILFGENGSGKTGYSRIIKRIAAVRTAEDILSNIHDIKTKTPVADFAYKLGGEEHSIRWNNEAGVSPFTRISVFDAPAVSIHVDNELNYVYTPVELALFAYIGDGVRGVQTLAEQEAASLRSGAPGLLGRFTRGTTIYPLIETLGVSSDLAELKRLGTISDAERASRAELEAEIAALRGNGLTALLDTARANAERMRRLLGAVELAAGFNVAGYESARGTLEGLQSARRAAREQAFAPNELAGSPDDEWQTFIGAAEHYRDHLNLETYPQPNDHCLYCRQPLAGDAVKLIRRYKDFLDDSLAGQVADAERAVRGFAVRAGDVRIQVVESDLAELAAVEPRPAYLQSAQKVVTELITTIELTNQLVAAPHAELPTQAGDLQKTLAALVIEADQRVTQLAGQLEDSAEALKVRQAEFLELDARITLEPLLPTITTYVEAAKRADRLTALAKALSTGVLRPLTELSKIASEDLVNQDFERLFREECEALRAPNVALEFQGRRGKAERKKAVANHRPSSVLSEGEQKVLALADFLAEGRMGAANAPILFDDPVTSLDYKRMSEVAARISTLANAHQVVVLTHNIMFASALLALRTSKKLRCKFYEVRDDDQQKGVIAPAGEPRSDTPADLEAKINTLLVTARKAEAVVRDALVSSAYGMLRSWCEAFVEQEVLQNVSQRYRVNIMMTNLSKIRADRLEETTVKLTPIFDRCSRFMPGHSQPQEQLNVQTSLADFEKDFAEAVQIRKAYIAK